ncbi:DUF1990 family protein [Glutamicibacter protophormiae]
MTTRTRIREEHWNPEPGGYRAWRRQTYLGSGDAFWEQSAAALLRWEVKTRSGFRISPQDKVRSGARPQIIVPVGPASIHEPVEVVDVVEADDVVGFAYRTLPGHPVSGEEAFILRRLGPSVFLEIRSLTAGSDRGVWRSVFWLLLGVQKLTRWRYLRALRQRRS